MDNEQQGHPSSSGPSFDSDPEIAEQDPEGKYYRYKEVVGKGRFKEVYKAFNSQVGIDVAWSKVRAEPNHLDREMLDSVADEMCRGLELDHPNIIRCFKCWKDADNSCINLITELFTSGNLRQYRNMHKHLDPKAVKRMARQILKGLAYLHSRDVTHGDLRCDKIYVNGHSGEIKIGDLGLATLLKFRWHEDTNTAAASGANADGGSATSSTTSGSRLQQRQGCSFNNSVDIFAFGLCMLELLTLRQLDPQHCDNWKQLLDEVQDDEANLFISQCLGPSEECPTAVELLNDPFLALRKDKPVLATMGADDLGSTGNLQAAELVHERRQDALGPSRSDAGGLSKHDTVPSGEANIAVGRLKGEDYEFVFSAQKLDDNKLRFKLNMDGVPKPGEETVHKCEIEFEFDPETDTADSLAAELSQQFKLSPTDTEICAAALKEYLAKELGADMAG